MKLSDAIIARTLEKATERATPQRIKSDQVSIIIGEGVNRASDKIAESILKEMIHPKAKRAIEDQLQLLLRRHEVSFQDKDDQKKDTADIRQDFIDEIAESLLYHLSLRMPSVQPVLDNLTKDFEKKFKEDPKDIVAHIACNKTKLCGLLILIFILFWVVFFVLTSPDVGIGMDYYGALALEAALVGFAFCVIKCCCPGLMRDASAEIQIKRLAKSDEAKRAIKHQISLNKMAYNKISNFADEADQKEMRDTVHKVQDLDDLRKLKPSHMLFFVINTKSLTYWLTDQPAIDMPEDIEKLIFCLLFSPEAYEAMGAVLPDARIKIDAPQGAELPYQNKETDDKEEEQPDNDT